MSTIYDAIYTKAGSHAGLTALIATRLYPGAAPQGATPPYVTYTLISGPREHAMGSDPGVAHPRFQFSAWAKTNTEARNVALQLMACFSRWRATVLGVEVLDSFLDNEIDLGRDDVVEYYQRAVDFIIHHRE